MENPFFSENLWTFGETVFSTHHGAKHSFQERVVLHDWIWCKTHFSARIRDNLAKRCFQLTMVQNTVFNKEFYFTSGFDVKRIF